MIIDKELQFADGTWAPTATGDNISTNVLDTGPLGTILNSAINTGRDLGQGEQLVLVITVKQAVTSGGAATVDFRLRTDSAANGTTSPVDLASTGAIGKATLVLGYQAMLKLPPAAASASAYKRYIMVNANIGTAVLTAGMFEAEIVQQAQLNKKYGSGFGLDS